MGRLGPWIPEAPCSGRLSWHAIEWGRFHQHPTECLSQCPDGAELRGDHTDTGSQQPHWLTAPPKLICKDK